MVIIGGMLCTYFYNLCSACSTPSQIRAAATFFLFVSVVINTVVDYLFVGVLELSGIAGRGVGDRALAAHLGAVLRRLYPAPRSGFDLHAL